jgi:hypothetical protein
VRSSPKLGPIHLSINLQKLIINTPQAVPKFFIVTPQAHINYQVINLDNINLDRFYCTNVTNGVSGELFSDPLFINILSKLIQVPALLT